MPNHGNCLIWPECEAEITDRNHNGSKIVDFYSERAGGAYAVCEFDFPSQLEFLDDEMRARLTTTLVDQRRYNPDVIPIVTKDLVLTVLDSDNLSVFQRAERLLRYIAQSSKNVGDSVYIKLPDDIHSGYLNSLAWSESTSKEEIDFLLEYLIERRFLIRCASTVAFKVVQVTVSGYSHIEEVQANKDSAQCFVAMWFNETVDGIYSRGFEPAVHLAGYRALRIDKKPDLNKIDDEIIAEIRRSRFLIADFTHGKDGARGGVYFEAGYALGIGIPVIYTCRSDMFDHLHFDTRQYHHIEWQEDEIDRFCKNLSDRIVAKIGEGPLAGKTP